MSITLDETSAQSLRSHLTATPRRLPSLYGYDEAGSVLYARIMQLPEYYLPAAEHRVLADLAPRLLADTDPAQIIDLGAGTAEKTEHLIAALAPGRHCTLVDIDPTIIEDAAARLRPAYPNTTFDCVAGTFTGGLRLAACTRPGPRLVVLLGSTLGNLDSADRASLLTELRDACQPGDQFLVTVDLHKDRDTIEAAYRAGYHDHDHIRRQFALNRLGNLNRQWSADFDPDNYEPGAYYDTEHRDVIAYLEARHHHRVTIDALGETLELQPGEVIIRDRMHKFTTAEISGELTQAGWTNPRLTIDDTTPYAAVLTQNAAD